MELYIPFWIANLSLLFHIPDGVPSSQNPTASIEAWINHNKVEREEFASVLQDSLKVTNCRTIKLKRENCISTKHCWKKEMMNPLCSSVLSNTSLVHRVFESFLRYLHTQ